MTTIAKKRIYNFNLFLLIITLALFMYWKKNTQIKDFSVPIISETSNIHPYGILSKVKFEE